MASPREPALCQLFRHTFVPDTYGWKKITVKSSPEILTTQRSSGWRLSAINVTQSTWRGSPVRRRALLVPLKCMAVKNSHLKKSKMADSRYLENRKIANISWWRRTGLSSRPPHGFIKLIFNGNAVETGSAVSCQILCMSVGLLQISQYFGVFLTKMQKFTRRSRLIWQYFVKVRDTVTE